MVELVQRQSARWRLEAAGSSPVGMAKSIILIYFSGENALMYSP